MHSASGKKYPMKIHNIKSKVLVKAHLKPISF